jgi:hypothetical protein
MYKFSLLTYKGSAILFGGMYVTSPQSKGNCSNSIIRVSLTDLTYEHIKTQGEVTACRLPVLSMCAVRLVRLHGCSMKSCWITGESDAPKRPHTRHGHSAVVYADSMLVLGGETDAQTRMKDCSKCSSHWAHIIWKLDLTSWQWHRIEPEVCTALAPATCMHGTNALPARISQLSYEQRR